MIAQSIRLYVIWPVTTVFGLAWVAVFLYRYRYTKNAGDHWAAALGLANALLGLAGIGGLFLRSIDADRFGELASWLFSVGGLAICAILILGVGWRFLIGFRNGGSHD